jgi:hypothetical protein
VIIADLHLLTCWCDDWVCMLMTQQILIGIELQLWKSFELPLGFAYLDYTYSCVAENLDEKKHNQFIDMQLRQRTSSMSKKEAAAAIAAVSQRNDKLLQRRHLSALFYLLCRSLNHTIHHLLSRGATATTDPLPKHFYDEPTVFTHRFQCFTRIMRPFLIEYDSYKNGLFCLPKSMIPKPAASTSSSSDPAVEQLKVELEAGSECFGKVRKWVEFFSVNSAANNNINNNQVFPPHHVMTQQLKAIDKIAVANKIFIYQLTSSKLPTSDAAHPLSTASLSSSILTFSFKYHPSFPLLSLVPKTKSK